MVNVSEGPAARWHGTVALAISRDVLPTEGEAGADLRAKAALAAVLALFEAIRLSF